MIDSQNEFRLSNPIRLSGPSALELSIKQSYEIKSPPWKILWFRILGIFSVENIKRLCVFMLKTWDNSQLLRRVLWISAKLTIVSSLKHKNTQPLYIFNRVRVLHLDRLKEGTCLHSFACMTLLFQDHSDYQDKCRVWEQYNEIYVSRMCKNLWIRRLLLSMHVGIFSQSCGYDLNSCNIFDHCWARAGHIYVCKVNKVSVTVL